MTPPHNPVSSRRLLIALSAIAALLTMGGALSFIRYAQRHRPDPRLVAIAPFDIFVSGLEPWRVQLARGLTDGLNAAPPPAAVSQDVVRERWRGQDRPTVAAVELARRTSAGAAIYGRVDPIAERNDSVRVQVVVAEAGSGRVLFLIDRRWPPADPDGLARALTEQVRRQFPRDTLSPRD
jgi:hypothetical protein